MSGCRPFDIQFLGDLDQMLKRFQEKAAKEGITLSGDTTAGDFSGKGIKGNYTVSNNIVTITVTSKRLPASLLGCDGIETKIRSFFHE